MLKIQIVAVGKDKDHWVSDGCSHFEKMLSGFADIQWKIISSSTTSSSISASEIKKREGERLIKEFGKGINIALADRGELMDSPALAKKLERWQIQSKGMVSFFIGGAYGLDDTILNRSDLVLSLSSLTFSHQLIRLVLLEQLFRAFSILKGTAYHK